MYSLTTPMPGNVDIELPLVDASSMADIEMTLATAAGRGGAFAGAFAPTLSQVAAYPQGAALRPQDFLRMSA